MRRCDICGKVIDSDRCSFRVTTGLAIRAGLSLTNLSHNVFRDGYFCVCMDCFKKTEHRFGCQVLTGVDIIANDTIDSTPDNTLDDTLGDTLDNTPDDTLDNTPDDAKELTYERTQSYYRLSDGSQAIDHILPIIEGMSARDAWCIGNALKYLARYKRKPSDNPTQDLRKAVSYIEILMEMEEAE